MAKSQFMIWSKQHTDGQCVIGAPKGIQNAHRISDGISLLKGWPEKVTCRMSEEYPKDIELTDNLFGTELAVVSKTLRTALESHGARKVEYLPVQIFNHKDRVASKDYFLVNPPFLVECIDARASKVEWNPIDPELIDGCERLVIDPDRVDGDLQLFRPKHLGHLLVCRKPFAAALSKAKFTGLAFRDPLDYRGM